MKRVGFVVVLAAVLCCGQVFADSVDATEVSMLKLENSELRHRIEALEDALNLLQRKIPEEDAVHEADETTVLQSLPLPVLSQVPETKKPGIASKYDVELYGYFKWDGARDDSRVSNGNFVQWVNSEATRADDAQYNMTANQSRFGLKFLGPKEGDAKVSGLVEFDFYGGGTQNKPNPMMRQAFGQVYWAKSDLALTFGQTTDVIAPLVPTTLNYAVAWWAGNIGYRHPQLRLTKGFEAGKHNRFELQLAAVRQIGDAGPFTFTDTGADSGRPAFQGRLAYTFQAHKKQKGTIGISGHRGKEEYKNNATTSEISVDSKSACVDVALPLCDKIQLRGEAFRGENIDDYLGGIAQGVVITNASGTRVNVPRAEEAALPITRVEAIKSKGGWAELVFGPFQRWTFNLGMSRETLDTDILPNAVRTENQARWLTILHDINTAVQAGLEVSRWETNYKNADQGVNNRIQTSITYKF